MRFALAPKEAGAHGTSAGEMGVDIIGPRLHRKWAHPYDCKMIGAVTAPDFPLSLHICGDSTSGPRRNTVCTTLMARCKGDDLRVGAEESLSGQTPSSKPCGLAIYLGRVYNNGHAEPVSP